MVRNNVQCNVVITVGNISQYNQWRILKTDVGKSLQNFKKYG